MNSLLFGALSVALALASCDNKDITGADNGDNVVEGLPAVASISISQSGSNTRGTTPSTTATDAEKTISGDVTIFVFSEGSLTSIATIPSSKPEKKVEIPTTTGRKQLFAVANVPPAFLANIRVEDHLTLKQVKTQLLDVASIADPATDNNFWLTNYNEAPVVTVQASSGGTVLEANKFTINIGRACAKVSLDVTDDVDQNSIGGKLTDIKYRVCNNPKRMNLLPDFEVNNTSQLLTPYYSLGWNDTGADTGTGALGTAVNAGSYFGNNDGTPPTFTEMNGGSNSQYMMENSNNPVLRGKATYLSIQGKWTPNLDQLMKADGSPATEADRPADGSFWRIAIVSNKGMADEKITGYESYCYAGQPTGTVNGVDPTDGTHQAVQFAGGTCYYSLWIADNSQNDAAKKYSVWRNRYYRVRISDVKGPGTSTEDEVVPDPTDPVEQNATIEGTIAIDDWTAIDQTQGI